MDRLLAWLGHRLAKYLATPLPQDARAATSPPEKLAGALEPGDVLLVQPSELDSPARLPGDQHRVRRPLRHALDA